MGYYYRGEGLSSEWLIIYFQSKNSSTTFRNKYAIAAISTKMATCGKWHLDGMPGRSRRGHPSAFFQASAMCRENKRDTTPISGIVPLIQEYSSTLAPAGPRSGGMKIEERASPKRFNPKGAGERRICRISDFSLRRAKRKSKSITYTDLGKKWAPRHLQSLAWADQRN